MTLAEIIRAQLATGRPLRVTRALLEALAEPPAVLADDPLYSSWTALCRALALPASTPGPAIVAAVVAIRETAKHDREERDEARRELSHRPTMIAHTAACRERDEARAEVERLRTTSWPAERRDIAIREAEVRGAQRALDAADYEIRGSAKSRELRATAASQGSAARARIEYGAEVAWSEAHRVAGMDAARICEAARKAGEHDE